jgi:hypothetical protein
MTLTIAEEEGGMEKLEKLNQLKPTDIKQLMTNSAVEEIEKAKKKYGLLLTYTCDASFKTIERAKCVGSRERNLLNKKFITTTSKI